MEQSNILTKEQRDIVLRVSQNKFLAETFYFTGGTALSEVYLQHRYSEDLDFFSPNKFDPKIIHNTFDSWAKELGTKYELINIGDVYVFNLNFPNNYTLKIDFAWYDYKNLAPFTIHNGIKVDSLKDIASNKFVAVGQRTDIKDFVDLYFLLNQFSPIDLYEWSNTKFRRKYDLLLFASDLMKIEEFEYLPRMIKEIDLGDLKLFYNDLAKNLGMKATDK